MTGREPTSRGRRLVVTALVALGARLLVAAVALACGRFPPADDGVLYDALARRLALGQGYTWAWPDGTVTAVAHYPVGYPALLALAYRVFGPSTNSALLLHVLVGTLGAVGVHLVAASGASPRAGFRAGLAAALHPALLLYTPAVMTEAVCASLLALPFALAVLARDPKASRALLLLAGCLLGAVAFVRPQVLVLAPFVALVARPKGSALSRLGAVLVVWLGASLALAPWALRNRREFGQTVLVSANGGWNLLIGTDAAAHGGWRALATPETCKEVWNEAAKDACFGQVARREMASSPLAWLALVPAKLAATFDVGGAGASYLSRSRPDLVPRPAVWILGGLETLFERLALLLALLLLGLERGPRPRLRIALALLASLFLLVLHAWPAYVALPVLLLLGPLERLEGQPVRVITLGVLGATALTHAVFFGAGRYALLVFPWVTALASVALDARRLVNISKFARHKWW